MSEKNITCEITRQIAVLSEKNNGYTKEANMVRWNGADAKLDIRNWHPNREKCGKGVTLSKEETVALYKAIKRIFKDEEL